ARGPPRPTGRCIRRPSGTARRQPPSRRDATARSRLLSAWSWLSLARHRVGRPCWRAFDRPSTVTRGRLERKLGDERRARGSRDGRERAPAEDPEVPLRPRAVRRLAFYNNHAARGVTPVHGRVRVGAVRLARVEDADRLAGRRGELLE